MGRRPARICIAGLAATALAPGIGAPAQAAEPVERVPHTEVVGRPPPIVQGPGDPLPCGLAGSRAAGYAYADAVGTLRLALLFVDFSDAPSEGAAHSPDSLFNGYVERAAPAFRELSYGKFGLEVDPLLEWVRMPKPLAEYGFDPQTPVEYQPHHDYIADAVAAADPEFDFSGYGAVAVIAASPGYTPGAATTENRGSGFDADGNEILNGFTLASTDAYDRSYPVFLHETAHLLGLPDLYPYGGAWGAFAGTWDVMSASSGPDVPMTAWNRTLLGWLRKGGFACVAKNVKRTLVPVSEPDGRRALIIRRGQSKAYTVEVRADGNPDGCRRDGVLLYVVKPIKGSGEGPVRVMDSEASTGKCAPHDDATFLAGDRFRSKKDGFTMRVVRRTERGFRVAIKLRGN
jgi:M6 family metalloprotease-like protein